MENEEARIERLSRMAREQKLLMKRAAKNPQSYFLASVEDGEPVFFGFGWQVLTLDDIEEFLDAGQLPPVEMSDFLDQARVGMASALSALGDVESSMGRVRGTGVLVRHLDELQGLRLQLFQLDAELRQLSS